MYSSKKFHLGDILSITTDILLSPSGMDGIYDICNYMTGIKNPPQSLDRAGEECKIALLQQYPQLSNIEVPKLYDDTFMDWLQIQIDIYGEFLSVNPLSPTKLITRFKMYIEHIAKFF